MNASTDLFQPGPLSNNVGPANVHPPRPMPLRGQELGRPTVDLTSIAMLIVLLGAMAAAVLNGRSSSADGDYSAPVIFAPATPLPAAGATDEMLAEFTLSPDALKNPAQGGDRFSIGFFLGVIPANTTSAWISTSRADHVGRELVFIISGTATLTSDGPVQVIRADGNGELEEHAAKEDVMLAAGDAVFYHLDLQSTWVTGSSPAEVANGYVDASPAGPENAPDEWTAYDYTYIDNAGPVPTNPIATRLRRVMMEPDGVETFEPGVLRLALIEHGGPGLLGEGSDGSVTLKGAKQPTAVYFFIVEPADEDSATPQPS